MLHVSAAAVCSVLCSVPNLCCIFPACDFFLATRIRCGCTMQKLPIGVPRIHRTKWTTSLLPHVHARAAPWRWDISSMCMYGIQVFKVQNSQDPIVTCACTAGLPERQAQDDPPPWGLQQKVRELTACRGASIAPFQCEHSLPCPAYSRVYGPNHGCALLEDDQHCCGEQHPRRRSREHRSIERFGLPHESLEYSVPPPTGAKSMFRNPASMKGQTACDQLSDARELLIECQPNAFAVSKGSVKTADLAAGTVHMHRHFHSTPHARRAQAAAADARVVANTGSQKVFSNGDGSCAALASSSQRGSHDRYPSRSSSSLRAVSPAGASTSTTATMSAADVNSFNVSSIRASSSSYISSNATGTPQRISGESDNTQEPHLQTSETGLASSVSPANFMPPSVPTESAPQDGTRSGSTEISAQTNAEAMKVHSERLVPTQERGPPQLSRPSETPDQALPDIDIVHPEEVVARHAPQLPG